MNIFNFSSFISSRYPCTKKSIKGCAIPEYDHLYLDITSILYNSVDSNAKNSYIYCEKSKNEISKTEIFKNISYHIDFIFRAVKPTKLMYLAFDGVAPCAKLNHHRSNRFRTAKNDKSTTKNEISHNGALLDTFDRNCFTAGTAFMAELTEYLKHFLAYKISTSPMWYKCIIVISGPEVPGESKFKILELIRYNKAQSSYNPNTMHCLYSFDPDSVLLGLSTHEPYFALLQQVTPFMSIKHTLTPEETDFHIFHLSLVREYLECEFSEVKSNLKFKFDLEKIIDDWILIGLLVSDDSLPALAYLNIEHGALPIVLKAYMKVLPSLHGYINESGKLIIDRLEKFMHKLSCIEKKLFELIDLDETFNLQEIYMNILENGDFSNIFTDCRTSGNKRQKERDLQLQQKQKENYYKLKFKRDDDEDFISALVVDYVKSIQWTLNYYYNGCSSWSWLYPHHYPPLVSDIKNLRNIVLKFEMGKPFLPLEYLLAVSPPKSNNLLPESLRYLSTNPQSPIIHFFPEEINVDLNYRSKDADGLIIVPLIDEEQLKHAMKKYISSFTSEESNRNSNGKICTFTYTEANMGPYSLNFDFDSFINYAKVQYKKSEDFVVSKEKIVKGLCRKVELDSNVSGVPTLRYISHKYSLEVKKSTSPNLCTAENETMNLDLTANHISRLQDVAKELLGKSIFINWPYIDEAYVYSVTDFKNKISLRDKWTIYCEENIRNETLADKEILKLNKIKTEITDTYNSLQIDIGETKILVTVCQRMGQQYEYEALGKLKLRNKFDIKSIKFVPYQLVIKILYNGTLPVYKLVTNVLKVSSVCFMIEQPHYGSIGKVKSVSQDNQRMTVTLKVDVEPSFEKLLNNDFNLAINNNNNVNYLSSSQVARKLGISSQVLNKISGFFWITKNEGKESDPSKKCNIGLQLKWPKIDKEQLPGYTMKKNDVWYYTDAAVNLIQTYVSKFPILIEKIGKNGNLKDYKESDLFTKGSASLKSVEKWLNKSRIPASMMNKNENTLHRNVKTLENIITTFLSEQKKSKSVDIVVSSNKLFKSETLMGTWPIDLAALHDLLDRVICVKENFTVPLGLKGTIIGINSTNENRWNNIYEILFDVPFQGGLTLYGSSEHRYYRLTVADFVNISYGSRNQIIRKWTNDERAQKMAHKKKLMKEKEKHKESEKSQKQKERKPSTSKVYHKFLMPDFRV